MPMTARAHPSLSVTLVTAAGCHLCADARATIDELVRAGVPIDVFTVDAASPGGTRLIERYRPGLLPLVLVEGAFFSSGRLPRRKLRALGDRFVEPRKEAVHG